MERHEPPSLLTRTHTSLLEALKDSTDQTRWGQYVDRYRPTLVRCAAKLGLSAADAEDVAQNALMEFSRSYREGRYDRDKGRLRSWLFGILHHQIQNWRKRRRVREVQVQGERSEDPFDRLPARDELETLFEAEWRHAVLRQCLLEIRREVTPETYRAFQRFAVEGRPSEEVAAELAITRNAVFLAKRRVLARLKELTPLMEEIW
jgi:RNA polymerase sigma-70 factor (ECF subfamily)